MLSFIFFDGVNSLVSQPFPHSFHRQGVTQNQIHDRDIARDKGPHLKVSAGFYRRACAIQRDSGLAVAASPGSLNTAANNTYEKINLAYTLIRAARRGAP